MARGQLVKYCSPSSWKGGWMQSKSANIMSLKKLVSQYKEKKDSGLLSVKVEGQEHLLKIYFELGMVVGLSLGTLKNDACIDILGTCNPIDSAFIKGYKTPDFVVAEKDEINNKLEGLFASYPVTGGMTTDNGTHTVKVKADDLIKLETDFINIIGPIGKMLVDTIYSEIGYSRGTDMPSPLYSQLIDKLKESIPEQHHATFAAKYAIGLALDKK
jgi:hypothetical protein